MTQNTLHSVSQCKLTPSISLHSTAMRGNLGGGTAVHQACSVDAGSPDTNISKNDVKIGLTMIHGAAASTPCVPAKVVMDVHTRISPK